MRRTVSTILAGLALGWTLSTAALAAEVPALRIRGKVFESESRTLSYELWNESTKTITGWRLSLARSDLHGHAQKSVLDQDFFDRVAESDRERERGGPLPPGASSNGTWHLDIGDEGSETTALSLQVAAVVFEDWTWQGDEPAVRALLEARQARVEEIGRVLSSLEATDRWQRSRHEWSAALRQQASELRQRGRNVEDADASSRVEAAAQLSATRLELAQWLDEASQEVSLAPDPGEAFRHLRRELTGRYENAMRAMQQRQSESGRAAQAPRGER